MLAISISAVLLCLVGVWAAVQMNLNFHGKVSPDIHCKIVVNNATPIFDNSGSMGAQISSGNTLSTSVTLNAGVTNEVTFTLTNYTDGKYIRLSVAGITASTTVLSNKDDVFAVCENTSGATSKMTLSLAGTTPTNITTNPVTNAIIHLKVEEVYKVTVSGNGLATGGGAHYFAPSDACNITLEPAVGYQLPESLEIANSSHGEYRTNNTTGTVTINKTDLLGNDVAITANCNQIFAVKESTAQTLGTAGDTNVEINSQTTYLPNNGHYTYTDETKTAVNLNNTAESKFVEYPFYVEMGMYPQKVEVPSGTPSLDTKTGNYVLGDKAYAKINDTYYLFEPIKWIVLEVLDINGDNVDFDDVYCVNDMLCTDPAGGKPFKGELVLMSAFVLDSSAFNEQTDTRMFSSSTINSNLKNDLGNKITGENGVKLTAITNNQYIKTQQNLTSQKYTGSGTDADLGSDTFPTSFFLLGGAGTFNPTGSDITEDFYAGDYNDILQGSTRQR